MNDKVYTQYISEFGIIREVELTEEEAKKQANYLRESILKIDKIRDQLETSINGT